MPVLGPKKTMVWLKMAIFGLCVPVLFLLLLEGTLRVADYGFPTHFFQKQQINGQDFYVTNYKFSWRFFPPRMARLSAPLAIPVHKAPGTIRVFILGSSAAMGDPEPAFAFSRHLEVMLKERFPGKKIEVYNTGATAINSNVVLPVARDCLDMEPDLFVLYTGNNEVVGPYGPAAVLAPFLTSRSFIKFQVALGETKTGQLVKKLLAKKSAAAPQEWGGMELFLESKLACDSPKLGPVYSHFHDNLAEICQRAQHKGVKVVLSTLIVNDLDCAPFVSLHKSGIDDGSLQKFDSLFQSGKKSEDARQWQQAIQSYTQAANIDETYAELQFRLGHCYFNCSQTNEARKCFGKARDYDALRFRADTRLNDTVRQVAKEQPGVFLADAQEAAQRNSPGGIPGATLLYEHVHLTFEGNYLLAGCVLDQAEKALGLKSPIEKPTLTDCRKRLAYTWFDEQRIYTTLLGRYKVAPFTSQLNNSADIKRLNDLIADLQTRLSDPTPTDRLYRDAIVANPQDWWLHHDYMAFLFELRRYNDALQQAQVVYKQLPFSYLSMVNMGVMLQKIRNFEEAENYFNQAIAFNPYFHEAYENRASLYEDEQKFDAAEAFYRSNDPAALPEFYNRMGIFYAKDHHYDTAAAYFQRALSLNPNLGEAKKNLDSCQQRQKGGDKAAVAAASDSFNEANRSLRNKDYPTAIELYKKAIAEDPNFAKAHNNLGIALIQVKNYDEAAKAFTEAARLNMPDATPNLAGVLSLQGKHQEAIDMVQKAVADKPSRRLYALLAQEYEKMGKHDEAQSWSEKAKDPSVPQ